MSDAAGAPGERGGEDGFALVAVLWFLLLVAAIVTPFAVAARTDFLIASNAGQKLRLDTLADGIATLTTIRVLERTDAGAVLRSGLHFESSPIACVAGKYAVGIRLQDQAGLIDLNAADENLLSIGLLALGRQSRGDAEIVDAIIKYRTPALEDTSPRPVVAVLGGQKGGMFESVVELSDFQPLRAISPAELHRVFTVQARSGGGMTSRAPVLLAGLLKASGAAADALVAADAVPAALAVEVTVRDPATAIAGYSGFLVEPADAPLPPFRRTEQLFAPEQGAPDMRPGQPCPASLQRDIAGLFAGDRQ